MQRFIREVNTTSRACVLWDLAEDADYIIQVQSINLYGESPASKKVHFRTLKQSDRLVSNSSSSNHGRKSGAAWRGFAGPKWFFSPPLHGGLSGPVEAKQADGSVSPPPCPLLPTPSPTSL